MAFIITVLFSGLAQGLFQAAGFITELQKTLFTSPSTEIQPLGNETAAITALLMLYISRAEYLNCLKWQRNLGR